MLVQITSSGPFGQSRRLSHEWNPILVCHRPDPHRRPSMITALGMNAVTTRDNTQLTACWSSQPQPVADDLPRAPPPH
jgi:hypothetical protein